MIFEVQRGTYTGEDDIVRLDDDYGRLATPDPSRPPHIFRTPPPQRPFLVISPRRAISLALTLVLTAGTVALTAAAPAQRLRRGADRHHRAQARRRAAARPGRRHPRLRRARVRQARDRARAGRPRVPGARHDHHVLCRGGATRAAPGFRHGPGPAGRRARRRDAAAPGAGQPDRQRPEVHRAGRGDLRVRSSTAPDGGDQLLLEVSVTGIGIHPNGWNGCSYPSRRWTPRPRAGSAARLGLAICRLVVDALGSTIAVQSAPGEGSNVTVCLADGGRRPHPSTSC